MVETSYSQLIYNYYSKVAAEFHYVCILSTSLSEPSISFLEIHEFSDKICPFWSIYMANKNNHFDIIVHVTFWFRSVPPQLLLITPSVLLLVDLFYAWGAYYLHSLRYTVISCHICSTQNIFAVKSKLFFSRIWYFTSKCSWIQH